MNRLVFFRFLTVIAMMLFNQSTFANGTTPGGATAIDTGAPPDQGTRKTGNALLNEMLEHPDVKPIAEKCAQKEGSDPNFSSQYDGFGDCIWKDLPLEKRTALADYIKTEEAKAGKSGNYDSLDLGTDTIELTPEMEKMQNFMAEKMSKSLNGEDNKKLAGHGTFYQLYKTSLGKNVMQTLSAYCMGTNFDLANRASRFLYEPKELKKNAEEWDKSLTQNSGNSIRAVELWGACVKTVQFVCIDAWPKLPEGMTQAGNLINSTSTETSYDQTGKAIETTDGEAYCQDPQTYAADVDDEEIKGCKKLYRDAQAQACVVVRALKDAKYAMRSVDKIINQFKKLSSDGSNTTFETDVERYESKGENSINEMTTFTSKELIDDAGLKGEFEANFEKFKADCFENGVLKTSDGCQEFINTNRDDKKNEIAEYLLRRRAMEEKLKKDFEDDEKVKEALVELGYSEEKAAGLMAIGGNSDYVKGQLRKRLAAETDAIHQALVDKMNAYTSAKDGVVTQDADQATLARIDKELSSKTDRMRQLIRFNNIVTGFLDVQSSEGEGKLTKNLLPLQRELGTLDGNNPGEDAISRAISNTGITEGGGAEDGEEGDNATLGEGTINDQLINLERSK